MNSRIARTTIAAVAMAGLAAAVAVPAQAATKSYTAAQVAKHRTPGNCWSSINGSVYNLTSWIARHPGGSGAIISLCGKDGSAAFNSQHGRQGSPTSILASYRIGKLK